MAPPVAGCGQWAETASPNPAAAKRSVLNDVNVLAPWDAWAVGVFSGPIAGEPTDRDQSLAMHWNGSAWSIVSSPSPGPNPSTTSVELNAVAGVGTDDVWAVGRKNGQDAGGYLGSRVLAMHWDGFAWTDRNAPGPPNRDGSVYTGASGEQLYDVSVLSFDAVWMVGRYWHEYPGGLITWPGVAMRWNGSSFEVFEFPMASPSNRQWANAVAARAADDVWAVGDGDGAAGVSYIWHWNGSSWAHVPGPAPGTDHVLQSVVALASDDVWAGGSWRDAAWTGHPLLLHWNGSGWTQVPTPAGGELFAAWAPGDILTSGVGGWAHWDGSVWTAQPGPTGDPSATIAAAGVVSPCELLAVGRKWGTTDFQTLALRLEPANLGDRDLDGTPDETDNCPDHFNPDQVDCDADGEGDVCELVTGTSNDCNGNALPDECETFADCDSNGIPDECQADCNRNDLPDACDIAAGTSRDCQPDGIPDECETFDDCNANGIDDNCDLRSDASADSNGNGHPDECEALGPDDLTVTTIADVVDFGGARRQSDLPGPDGLVSFREATIAANNTPGPQRIAFNIPRERWDPTLGTSPVLRLEDGIFLVTGDATEIDFTTQTLFTGDTNPVGGEVGIFGLEPNAWGITAIQVSASDCVVRGMGMVQLRGYGISLSGNRNRVVGSTISGPWYAAVYIHDSASGNVVGGTLPGEGNYLSSGNHGVRIDGPDAADNLVVGNVLTGSFSGVAIRGGATRNRIGGPTPAERNVISGAGHYGEEGFPDGEQVKITDSPGNAIEGNYIGTNADGTAAAVQTGPVGVLLRNASGTTVRGNLIAGLAVPGTNHYQGQRFGAAVAIQGASVGNVIEGNLIGTDVSGGNPIPNRSGIVVQPFPGAGAPAATLVRSNLIAFNETIGVWVDASVSEVTVSENSIFDNGGLGLELAGEANGAQAAPLVTAAASDDVSVTVEGSATGLPGAVLRVEFFANAVCDPSGAGEGAFFLGSTTVTAGAGGSASFQVTLSGVAPPGSVVTATATALASGNTSEFSTCRTVEQVACSGAPPEVTRVTLQGTTLYWEPFGPSILYDVARGSVAGLWAAQAATCLASATPNAFLDDLQTPGAGQLFNYLVRARNACGAGPWGSTGLLATCQ